MNFKGKFGRLLDSNNLEMWINFENIHLSICDLRIAAFHVIPSAAFSVIPAVVERVPRCQPHRERPHLPLPLHGPQGKNLHHGKDWGQMRGAIYMCNSQSSKQSWFGCHVLLVGYKVEALPWRWAYQIECHGHRHLCGKLFFQQTWERIIFQICKLLLSQSTKRLYGVNRERSTYRAAHLRQERNMLTSNFKCRCWPGS